MRDFLTEMLYALTSAYTRKDYDNCQKGSPPDTNIGKLFSIFAWGLDTVQEQTKLIRLWDNIDNACGSVLDKHGANFGVQRYGTEDIFYRLIIKMKLLSQLSGGDIDTVLNIAAALFEIPVENIELIELFPANIRIDIQEMDLTPEKITIMTGISTILKRILAAGVGMILRIYCKYFYKVSVRYENLLTMNSGFYPRCNIPEIFLDASSYLDGTYPLNGYQHTQDISPRLLDATDLLNGKRLLDGFWEIQIPEFYPARLTVRGRFHNNLQFLQQLHIVLETLLSIRLEPSIQIASRFFPRNNIPLLYVNAEAALDGEFLLNGRMDIWNLSFLYLTGMASLDGVCPLNGYEDNPSYEFYPASMEVFTDYQTPIRLSEQVHSVMEAQLPLPLTATSNLSITSKFYYSFYGHEECDDVPSCLLNGEASLDGMYSFNGYQNNQDFGIYPITLQVKGGITQKIEVFSQSEVRWNTPLLIESESNCSIIGEANKEIAYETDLKLSGQIKQPVLWNPETMTVEYHVWYLDGKKGLNGQVCLDADIYEIEL